MNDIKVDDTVIYQLKRWRVLRIRPQIQSADYTVPHKPDHLRLWRSQDNEAVWAPADKVVLATSD